MTRQLLLLRLLVTMFNMMLLGLVGYCIMMVKLDPAAEKLIYALLTGVVGLNANSVGWWFSSSLSAAVSQKTVEAQSVMLAASTPPTPRL